MSSILNTTRLIATIKRRAFIPSAQSTFSDDDFLEMATEEINLGIMEKIIDARGDYCVSYVDVALDEDTTEYSIPARACGNVLRDVRIVNSDGELVTEMTQLELDMFDEFSSPTSFYVRNNRVVLSPNTPKSDQYLRMHFYMRPNKLVLTSRGATITAITDDVDGDGVATKVFAFSSLPTHFTSGILYDLVSAASPNKIAHFDLEPVTVNLATNEITFYAADVTEAIIGDFLTMAEETIVPNIPTELHPIVAQRVAIACLEGMGDEVNKQSAERKLASMEKSALKIITNRVEGSPKKIRQKSGTLHAAIRYRNSSYRE